MNFLTRLVEKNLGQGNLAKPLISSQFESERHIVNNSFADMLHKNEINADVEVGISAEFYDQPLISNHKNTNQYGKTLESKSFEDQPLPVITKYDFDQLVKSKEDRASQKSIETESKSNETYLIPKPNLVDERDAERKISSKDEILPKPNFPIKISPRRESLAMLPNEELGMKSEKSSSTPVIKVTIGRVEVKAIMPQESKEQRPKPNRLSPALSLESYLKQRNGGGK